MKGHTEDVCRQHLLCNRCDRRGHLAENCYAAKPKRPTLNNMVLTRNDRLPRWPIKVNGVIHQAILDSGAEHSVMSQATVERVGIQVKKSNEAIETSTGEICSVDVTQELELMFEHIPAYLNLKVGELCICSSDVVSTLNLTPLQHPSCSIVVANILLFSFKVSMNSFSISGLILEDGASFEMSSSLLSKHA